MNEGGQSKHKRELIGNKWESNRKRTGPPEANEGEHNMYKTKGNPVEERRGTQRLNKPSEC